MISGGKKLGETVIDTKIEALLDLKSLKTELYGVEKAVKLHAI
ncbi:hypothetical protein [Shewanella sp. BF02_Schw]|nr:hypothetical protein [Shewanella sp. BF02_Schw]